jgi:hypothetical protein
VFDRLLADFKPLQGESFLLALDPWRDVTLVLAEVEARTPPAGMPAGINARAEPFALFFESRDPRVCPQGNYMLRHPALGEGPLHLTPVAALPDGGFRYQAVFT